MRPHTRKHVSLHGPPLHSGQLVYVTPPFLTCKMLHRQAALWVSVRLGKMKHPRCARVYGGFCLEYEQPEWLEQMAGILETLNEGVLIVDDCEHVIFVNSV